VLLYWLVANPKKPPLKNPPLKSQPLSKKPFLPKALKPLLKKPLLLLKKLRLPLKVTMPKKRQPSTLSTPKALTTNSGGFFPHQTFQKPVVSFETAGFFVSDDECKDTTLALGYF
jgi:hypothetical protein